MAKKYQKLCVVVDDFFNKNIENVKKMIGKDYQMWNAKCTDAEWVVFGCIQTNVKLGQKQIELLTELMDFTW